MKSPLIRMSAVAAAAVLALSACSSGGGGDASGADGAEELVKLTVAVSPGAATSTPMYLAADRGVFAEHGLEVELIVLEDGAVAIPNTLNGQTQFSMAGFGSAVQAIEKGIPIRLVGAANVFPSDPDSQYQAIIVNKEAGITEASQIETWAADTTEVDPAHAFAVDALGGDYAALTKIAVPFPAIGDAVADGTVDAAAVNEPFLSAALETGKVEVLSYVAGDLTFPGSPGAVFISSIEYMEQNPEITEQFLAAIQEAYSYAAENLEEVANFVPNTGLNDKVPPVVALGEYQVGPLRAELVQPLIDVFAFYGAITGDIPASEMIHTS
ncbi:MAG: ABC transporter substrate-binding protein [Leucobacter sp.]